MWVSKDQYKHIMDNISILEDRIGDLEDNNVITIDNGKTEYAWIIGSIAKYDKFQLKEIIYMLLDYLKVNREIKEHKEEKVLNKIKKGK